MTKPNAFAGLGKMMKTGALQQLMTTAVDGAEASFSRVEIAEIKLFPQQRETLEIQGEQTLEELAQDIKDQGVLQPIVICEMAEEDGKRFRLVAGERRYRAATLAGLTKLPAMVYGPLTNEQIDKIQYAENIHRLNLSTLNEAKVLAEDFQELGSLAAVAKKRNKSEGWVSKRLALLKLGPEAQRVITENLSNDVEVILAVNQVEKQSPEKAAALVEQIKEVGAEKSGGNVRQIARAAKDEVKPKAHRKPKAKAAEPADDTGEADAEPLESTEEQKPLTLPATGDAKQLLTAVYAAIRMDGESVEQVVEGLGDGRKVIEDYLTPYYERGVETEEGISQAVFKGFQDGSFGSSGAPAVCLSAFLLGLEQGASFALPKILAGLAK